MKKTISPAFKAILDFENFMLKTKNQTAGELDSNMLQLKDLRKATYTEFIKTLDENNTDITALFDEYNAYCDFIIEFLTTNQLTNSAWLRVLTDFVNDYNIIKPYDFNASAYNATLTSLEFLSDYYDISDTKTSDHRFRFTNDLINEFAPDGSESEKILSE